MNFYANRQLAIKLLFISIALIIFTISNPAYSAINKKEVSTKSSSNNTSSKTKTTAQKKKAAAKKRKAAARKKAAAKKRKAAARKKAAAKKRKAAARKKAAAKKRKAAARKKAAAKKKTASKSSSKKKYSSSNSKPPNFVTVSPTRDLGIDKGYICFRVKAYSNTQTSIFSKPACSFIQKDTNEFKLVWSKSSSSVNGYQVYFGNSANKTNTLLADVR